MSENFELFDLREEIPGDLEADEQSFDVLFEESQQTFQAELESSEVEADVAFESVQQVGVPVPGGTFDHTQLLNRDAADQHPMSAISGLEKALEGKQPSGAYLTQETDPTVPSWAKKSTKPTYTASEIGALPNTTKIPSKTSDLINDSGFITGFTEQDPTVPSWAKQSQKPVYKASEVGADPSGSAAAALKSAQDYTDKKIASIPTPDVSGQISEHNTDPASHSDIRLLILGLTERLNALANSDDTTLDQMAEVVAYIKDNRELIEQVTTGKISVSDIIDNLTTNVSDKPLSAAQGVLLKGLVDSLATAVGGKLDTSALTEAINTALSQAKESGEFDGKPGKDGVSVSHRWIGTVLEVTSASGTSSTDLKGAKGDAGYTPKKTVDYWTAADVQAMVSEAVAETLKIIAPSKVDFNDGRFFAPAANVLYKPTTVSDTGITFQYKGGGGVEELYFPIVGLYPGRTYTIVFDETYNGGFIQDTYRYGCGVIQKAEYDSLTKPTTQAKPSWVAWHTGSTGKQSGAITFAANADVVYWGWSLGRLSDGKEVTINMNARVF